MPDITVRLFGQLTDITGSDTITIEQVDTIDELKLKLHREFPAIGHAKYVIAINNETVHENVELSANSNVAIMPPYSGG